MSAPLSVAARRPEAGGSRRRRLASSALVVALVLLLGAGWLLWDNRRLVVTEYEIAVASAPEAGGLRIAQVSDLHAADHGSFQDDLVDAITASDPDLIALTGDLVDVRTADIAPVLDLVGRLSAIAPAYFVLGNHEADSVLRDELLEGLEDAGVIVLRDEATTLEIQGREVTVVGLDDPRVAAREGREREDPATVLDRILPAETASDGADGSDEADGSGRDGRATEPRPGPVVLLAHRPELLDSYADADAGVDVVLSGHAHGGQVRLPLIGPLVAPHQGWFPELTEGVHRRGDMSMVISRGLGNSIIGVRVGNPRELVIVDLTPDAVRI
ncbi:metallophosphoesterase [Brachybacterium sp. DNPG3]